MEDRLQKFAALVDTGTFTGAARELHVSQPALSVAIQKLEAELHVRLFIRGLRQLTLTEAGHITYATAKAMRVCIENLDLELQELTHAASKFRLGMIDSVAATLFNRPASFAVLEKEANISLVVDNSRALLRAIERDELDIAFIAQPSHHPNSMVVLQKVAIEPLVLVAKIPVADLSYLLSQFVSYDEPSITFSIIQAALEGQGLKPQIAFSSTSPEVMLRMVVMGRGMAALPYLLVRQSLQDGVIGLAAPKLLPYIARGIVVAKRRDKLLAPPLKGIMLAVRRELQLLTAEATSFAAAALPEHTSRPPRR